MYVFCAVAADYLGLIICLPFWLQHRLSLALHGLLPILLRLQREEMRQDEKRKKKLTQSEAALHIYSNFKFQLYLNSKWRFLALWVLTQQWGQVVHHFTD